MMTYLIGHLEFHIDVTKACLNCQAGGCCGVPLCIQHTCPPWLALWEGCTCTVQRAASLTGSWWNIKHFNHVIEEHVIIKSLVIRSWHGGTTLIQTVMRTGDLHRQQTRQHDQDTPPQTWASCDHLKFNEFFAILCALLQTDTTYFIWPSRIPKTVSFHRRKGCKFSSSKYPDFFLSTLSLVFFIFSHQGIKSKRFHFCSKLLRFYSNDFSNWWKGCFFVFFRITLSYIIRQVVHPQSIESLYN